MKQSTIFETPLGLALLTFDDECVIGLTLVDQETEPFDLSSTAKHPIGTEVERQLTEYFAGERCEFDLPLAPVGTPFQREVWSALGRIPFGETRSYGEIAHELGRPKASRAVGAANGQNPIWIIVPCHRVIGANGSLTGYAGGLSVKDALLRHEHAVGGLTLDQSPFL